MHFRELPCSLVGFLPVDGDVLNIALMLLDKLFTHHKHAATATGWVVNSALVRLDHFHHEFDDGFWRVELPAFFPSAPANSPRKYSYTRPSRSFELSCSAFSSISEITSINCPKRFYPDWVWHKLWAVHFSVRCFPFR